MLVDFLGGPNPVISEVVPSTVLAPFDVGVSVQLRDLVGSDSTFPMESIYVLRHEELEQTSLKHGHVGHVCRGGERRRHGCLDSLLLRYSCFLSFVCGELPTSWACWEHGVHATSEIGNSSGRADAG